MPVKVRENMGYALCEGIFKSNSHCFRLITLFILGICQPYQVKTGFCYEDIDGRHKILKRINNEGICENSYPEFYSSVHKNCCTGDGKTFGTLFDDKGIIIGRIQNFIDGQKE